MTSGEPSQIPKRNFRLFLNYNHASMGTKIFAFQIVRRFLTVQFLGTILVQPMLLNIISNLKSLKFKSLKKNLIHFIPQWETSTVLRWLRSVSKTP